MRSRTYAFIPWITATTATRNPTDTMMPSSVKNDRSLWLQAVCRAWRIASERGMGGKHSGKREEGRVEDGPLPTSLVPLPVLLVPQRFDRIEPRGARGRIQSEPDAGQGGRGECREHGPQRHVRGDRSQMGHRERHP